MSDAEFLAPLRAARAARDDAREALYALELRRLALEKEQRRFARGEPGPEPAATEQLRALQSREEELVADLEPAIARLRALDELRQTLDETLARRAALHAEAAELRAEAARLRREAADPELAGKARDALVAAAVELEARAEAGEERAAVLESRAAAARLREQAADPELGAKTRAALEAAAADREARAAAAEGRAQALEGEAAALERRLRGAQPGADGTQEEIQRLQGELAAVRRRAAALLEPPVREDPGEALENARGEVERQRGVAAQREAAVRELLGRVFAQQTPQQLIERWNDDTPILLLPLRLETRFQQTARGPELWVRVFPDDIAVHTHERVLTPPEVEHGRAYWTALREAAGADARALARRKLAERFGENRAAWVAQQTRPLNWTDPPPAAPAPLQFPDAPLTKPDAWTVAPHSRVMPDRLVLLGFRGDEPVEPVVGNQIDDVLVLGPAPLEGVGGEASLSRDEVDRRLRFGESFRWLRDFPLAVERGMGFRLPLPPGEQPGFDRLLVLGLKHSAGAEDARVLVEELIENHRYSRKGFAVLPQGTPSNNTEAQGAGYSRGAPPEGGGFSLDAGPPRFVPVADRSRAADGQRLADYLGIGYAPLLHTDGAGTADHAEAVSMNRALYAGTLGYYLDAMLNEVVDDAALDHVRLHFTRHVTGRGPLAAIRVGSQPYGVLVTSALGRWRPSRVAGPGRPGAVDRFEAGLLHVVRRLEEAWRERIPSLVRLGRGASPAAGLLEVLGLHPTSAAYFQRVGYSWDYLRNLEEFAWGGREFDEVIGMVLEGMQARAVLRQLGYVEQDGEGRPKPSPLLLQLIWRNYHLPLDPPKLVDGEPLSETRLIQPYDTALGLNYVDWLLANAADADRLEAHDFGGAPRPTALLYLMLHFSAVLEAGRGIGRYLATRGVRADELVRSRKFMNIGAEPSVSAWEVFRAPANRVARAEASDLPLLELVHSPGLAAGALSAVGAGLREQREGLQVLRGLPTARLERALAEHVDTLSYRLDAWETSLFDRRLHRQRRLDADPGQRRTGVYLGAYGYLENVRPAPAGRRVRVPESTLPEALREGAENLFTEPAGGGFVHAASLNHATAAALLRNGFLTHASPGRPDPLAVNLSSERVRRARYLTEGIRNGQSLEVLLGVMFERGMHDWTTRPAGAVLLNHLKPALRAAFPIRRTRVPQRAGSDGPAEVLEDHQVVNGLELARTPASFPAGVAGLPPLSTAQTDALRLEKDNLANTLDALRDVLSAEGAYQLALGNFDRAAAVLQSAGGGQLPPDVEVIQTPRGTAMAFTSRLAVHLDPLQADNPWAPVPMTQRALLEPALNHWVGGLLGDPTEVRCRVGAFHRDGTAMEEAGVPVAGTVSLADLGVQPLDFVFLVRPTVDETGAAELESRVRYAFARARGVPDEAVVKIAFADAGGGTARSFAEVLGLAETVRRLLGASRPLNARHFQSASKDGAAADPANPGRIDAAELRARVGARLTAVGALFAALQAAVADARTLRTASAADTLRARLLAVADAGFAYAVPRSAVGGHAAAVDALVAQGESLGERFTAAEASVNGLLARTDAPGTPAGEQARLLADAAKELLGSDFVLLPRFTFGDPAEVALADAARDHLLRYARGTLGVPLPVEEWLHGAALVRPLVHTFEMVRAMSEALGAAPLACSALQLPFRVDDHWLGAEFPPGTDVAHDTVSMVQHAPQGFAPAGAQCGLLVDDWVESIPNREEVTGITFQYNQPNSAPPQALLLAVSPDETGSWAWDHLVDAVLDTFRRAKARAVEPDALGELPGIGTLLPAVVAEFSTGAGSVSLDYSFTVVASILAPPAAVAIGTPNPGS